MKNKNRVTKFDGRGSPKYNFAGLEISEIKNDQIVGKCIEVTLDSWASLRSSASQYNKRHREEHYIRVLKAGRFARAHKVKVLKNE